MSTSTGRKDDSGKLRWSLLPKTISYVIGVLEFGARKYAIDNWQLVGDSRRRYYDAAMRHIDAWWNGEKADPESELPHLAHACCCLLFLMWFDQAHREVCNVHDPLTHGLPCNCKEAK